MKKLLSILIIITLSACITPSPYIAPISGSYSNIEYDGSRTNSPPVVFRFKSFECEEEELISIFYEDGIPMNKVITSAKTGENFINTFQFLKTTPDFVMGGYNYQYSYVTTAFIPKETYDYQVVILEDNRIEVFEKFNQEVKKIEATVETCR